MEIQEIYGLFSMGQIVEQFTLLVNCNDVINSMPTSFSISRKNYNGILMEIQEIYGILSFSNISTSPFQS